MRLSLAEKAELARLLLAWYDRHRRVLPWRALPGEVPDPYRVWLSEIMLQQTTVAAVGPYFMKFLAKWPTLEALATAELEEVMQMWAGLGYYRRARGLHACARAVLRDHGGQFPSQEKALLALPGVGPYTAAAIRAIAFDRRANVVDGNVERVMARLFRVTALLPGAKTKLRELAEKLLPEERFGDYAQALMDLGATVCTPQKPKCSLCPWYQTCRALAKGDPEAWPKREARKEKPVRRGISFVAWDKRGAVFLQRRPEEGLLGGMVEVPGTAWEEKPMPSWAAARRKVPFDGEWKLIPGFVHHTFTHFDLELGVAVAVFPHKAVGAGWVVPAEIQDQALPSVMRKILRHAFAWQQKERSDDA